MGSQSAQMVILRHISSIPALCDFRVALTMCEALSGRGDSSAQAGEKGSGTGSLTANSSLSGPRGPGTFVEQSAVMASSGPGAKAPRPFPTATAPCTGPPTSLFRQFAPESPLPSPSFPLSQARFSGPCRRHEGVRGMCPRRKKAARPPTLRAQRKGCESQHRAGA